MTPKGKDFVAKIDVANKAIEAGMPIFAALAATLDDDDWLLVYAAVGKMIKDIEDQT